MKVAQRQDAKLLAELKDLVQVERRVLTKILRGLLEIERRKLFSDLGYGSLFDYAVKELNYSEGQAGRRIRAMRLMKEIPQIEASLASGELSLSNAAQAQSVFCHQAKSDAGHPLNRAAKIEVLKALKNKSSREGQKQLLNFFPLQEPVAKSFEKERLVTETSTEVRFLMTDKLKEKLEQVRALLGPKAVGMGYADLFEAMADLSAEKLAEKKFGKKRFALAAVGEKQQKASAQKLRKHCDTGLSKNPRYISRAIRCEVWQRDRGRCTQCGSHHNLNFDHIRPVARQGRSTVGNLRLLCHHCNQRQSIKVFGIEPLERSRAKVAK